MPGNPRRIRSVSRKDQNTIIVTNTIEQERTLEEVLREEKQVRDHRDNLARQLQEAEDRLSYVLEQKAAFLSEKGMVKANTVPITE